MFKAFSWFLNCKLCWSVINLPKNTTSCKRSRMEYIMNQDYLNLPQTVLSDILGAGKSLREALGLIKEDTQTYKKFLHFPSDEQQKILSFIAGQRGLKISYDSFFQKIMSPSQHPERLESFLSALLEDSVHIQRVLPREGIRIADDAGFIIMDILVQLSDNSLINVEMQKIGLYFPGERSSCYTADAIMRQYTELKAKLKNNFSYKEMKPFYLIVLMEHSSTPFRKAAPHYIHTERILYDSGAKVTSLSKIKYISLDTFKESVQNIDNKLQAWLTFFSSDEPADIISLINAYPEFNELYKEIAEFRQNPKELIQMYSEALAIADHNTIRLMIDDMQKELTSLTEQVTAKNIEINAKNNEIDAKNIEISKCNDEITRLKAEIEKLRLTRQ